MKESDDQLIAYALTHGGREWPNCPTPDCEYKTCDWAGEGLCAPCSLRKVGSTVMIVRWNRTHPDLPWDKPWPPGRPPRPVEGS